MMLDEVQPLHWLSPAAARAQVRAVRWSAQALLQVDSDGVAGALADGAAQSGAMGSLCAVAQGHEGAGNGDPASMTPRP